MRKRTNLLSKLGFSSSRLILFCSLFWASAAFAVFHEYDNLNRLVRSTYESGQIIEYSYDAVGNLLTVTNTLPPTDVTSSVAFQIGGLRYNRRTRRFVGMISITNNTSSAIDGPLHIVLNNLSNFATLVNADGTHNGAPYLTLPSGVGLSPGGSNRVIVDFSLSSRQLPAYTLQAYSGNF